MENYKFGRHLEKSTSTLHIGYCLYNISNAQQSEPTVVVNVPDTCNNSVLSVPMDINSTAQQSEPTIAVNVPCNSLPIVPMTVNSPYSDRHFVRQHGYTIPLMAAVCFTQSVTSLWNTQSSF